MKKADAAYKNTTQQIGIALILFFGIFTGAQVVYLIVQMILSIFAGEKTYNVVSSILWDALYLLSFMLPVAIFYAMSKNKSAKNALQDKNPTPKMILGSKLSAKILLIIPAALALNLVASTINSILVSPFNLSVLYEQTVYTPDYKLYRFLLDVIGTAIVPAFCEEFLFRGLILAALLPYGKKTAIIGSSVLFGLMHQNPAQLFYTTVLGMVLASIAVETMSIWGGVLLHFVNNFFGVVMDTAYCLYPEAQADYITNFLVLAILLTGAVCAVVLFVMYLKKRKKSKAILADVALPRVEDGVFGQSGLIVSGSENIAGYDLSRGYNVKGFFSPTIIIFAVLSAGTMLMLILSALLQQAVM